MSNQRIDMPAELRETGKHTSRALRRDRKVPAVVYGATENKNVYLEEGFVVKYHVRAHENTLFNLKLKDSKSKDIIVLMKHVAVHSLTRRPQHLDLFALDMTKTVKVSIEVKLEGKPIGIADGGLLNVVNRSVEVECLPTAIPEAFTADISGLGVGDSLHVSDLKLPAGVKLISSPDLTIAVVNLFVEEVIAAPTADAAAAGAAAPAAGAAAPAAGAAAPAAGKDAKAEPAKKEDKK